LQQLLLFSRCSGKAPFTRTLCCALLRRAAKKLLVFYYNNAATRSAAYA